MLGVARYAARLVFALACTTVLAGDDPTPRRVVVRPDCTDPEGSRPSEVSCRGRYDLEPEELPRLAELAAAREKECVQNSNGWACTWAGHRVENGEGVSRDAQRAARLYASACRVAPDRNIINEGCGPLALLARRLEEGDGFVRDPDEATALYIQSCLATRSPELTWMSGQPGCLELARVYLRGEIVPRDFARAAALYAAACDGPGSEREGCAGLVLVDLEGGLGAAPVLKESSRYWLNPGSLTAFCKEGAEDPIACRALALRYDRGSRVAADPRRARVLFERACARGDAPSCAELRAFCAKAPDDSESACIAGDGAAVVRACAAGDTESCWHRDLRICRGDLDLTAAETTTGIAEAWSFCVDARRGCRDGKAESCVSLARALAQTRHGLPGARERATEALERGLLLSEEGCARGDAPACHSLANIQSRSWEFASIQTAPAGIARERALALEAEACEAGDVEVCLRLADRYAHTPYDVPADPQRARRFYKRAAEIDRPACAAGDLKVCARLANTYESGLDDHSAAMAVWRRPCRNGAKKACDTLAGFEDNGAFGVTATVGARWGDPIGWSGSLSLVLGERYASDGESHTGLALPGYGGRGWLVQIEPGVAGGKIGVGLASTWTAFAPPFTTGRAIKLSYLRGWSEQGRLASGKDYAGVEADFSFIGLKGSVGLYKGVGRDRGMLLTWGVGLGF